MSEVITSKSKRALAKVKDVMQTEQWMAPSVKLTMLDTAARSIMLYGVCIWATPVI